MLRCGMDGSGVEVLFPGARGQIGGEGDTAVGVCGEAAADPLLACVLAGLGVNSLSSASTAIAGVGAQLSAIDFDTCVKAAEAAINAEGATEARQKVRDILQP